MPMRGDLSISARSKAWQRSEPRGHWALAGLQNPDLQLVLMFALFGLLACLALMLWSPLPPDVVGALSLT